MQHGPNNVWNASSLQATEAEPAALVASYRDKHSDFAVWLENNVPQVHHIRMQTANGIERPIQQKLKRRTSKVRVSPNRDSLERLSTAVLVEIDEKWETETNAYIKWEKRDD